MKHRLAIALTAGLILGSVRHTCGQGADAILDLLVRKGIITQREANDVREQLDMQMAQAVEVYGKGKFATWLDAVKFSGDLRLRIDDIMPEDSLRQPDRLRFRYRLRLGLEYQFPDWLTVNLRLASGDGDPVSTNQSFTDTFRKKPITIDLVSATIQPPGWDWIKLIGGKMENPIWQPRFNSPMIYDFDVTPEGIAEVLQFTFGPKGQYRIFGNFGQFVLDEISANSRDPALFDLQGGIELGFGGDLPRRPRLKITAAGGYMFTHNVNNTGYTPFIDSPNRGNATGTGISTNTPLADFNVVYGRLDVAWLVSERPFFGTTPLLTLSGEVDKNIKNAYKTLAGSSQTIDPDQTFGWTVQLAFGEARRKGEWQIAYQYKYLPADVTFDSLTDSDWGAGGTDRQGHAIRGMYNIRDWWQIGITAFLTSKISDRPNTGHNTIGAIGPNHGQEMLRILVDTSFRF
ncbi:MAG: putative porin [Verrucomicrobiae bacterium]|nr:putative porin [Verrucomicrobiae bacterium]